MLDERSGTRDAAAGFFRGLAAAARGYVGAKVNVARARNDQDLQKANFALETARLELIKQKQGFEQQHQQDVLDSQNANAQADRESRERLQEIVVDGQKAIAKITADGQIEIVTIQQAGETERAGIAEEGATERAGIAQDTAREGYQSQERIAQGQQEGETEREGIRSDAATGVAQIQADIQREVAAIQQEIAEKGYVSQESVARIEQMGKNMGFNFAGGVSMLNADEWGRLMDMMSKVSQNKDMTIIREIKGGFVTAMQGFIDASQGGPMSQQAAVANSEEAKQFGFSMADMAIINGYQRMIDPGATVREGDVDALIASMAKSEQLRAFVNQYIGTGGRFTPEGRAALAELVLNQYNANVDARVPGLSAQLQEVLRASGLEARGLGMGFFDLPQREQRTIEQILQSGGEWASGIGQEAGQTTQPAQGGAPEGSVPSGQAPNAGDAGASELPIDGWVEDYKKGREQGMSDEELDALLRDAMVASGVPEDQVESVFSQIKSRVGMGAGGEGGAENPRSADTVDQARVELDEAQRVGKVAAPSQLEVVDLDDEEIYRNLKVRFAPAGFDAYTEQEWNRHKGQAYQDMLDAGMSEEVAKALIAKIKAEITGSGEWAADTEE